MTKLYEGLTDRHYNDAFQLVFTAAEIANEMGLTNRLAGTLVSLKPHVRPSSDDPSEVSIEELCSRALDFKARILSDYSEVKPDGTMLTAKDFDEVALTKARDLWVLGPRMGTPYFTSRELVNEHPELLVPGMTRYVGGIWNRGRVTAFSGVQGDLDIAFSQTFDAWVTAQSRLAAIPLVSPENPDAIIGGQSARDAMFR